MYGLNACREINMGNSRHIGAQMIQLVFQGKGMISRRKGFSPFFNYRLYDKHIRGYRMMLEIYRAFFCQNGWCKRPERFAVLDLYIKLFLHFFISGIAYNTPSAQRPWSEFHASLHPAYHIAFSQSLRNLFAEFAVLGIMLINRIVFFCGVLNFQI